MSLLKNLFQSKTTQPASSENVPREVNMGEEMRRLMHRQDIEAAMESAKPFLLTAALAWPTVWLYRGFEWHTKRGKETLPLYIRKTFFAAKISQLSVLLLGLIYAIGSTQPRRF
ncbi:uncharacterized protein LOC105227969 [Bactrocera dorsalis]|uniref:Uncharacterized protein LOC105227969 n=1 Tax=Bactrocera dorsalis TaxID=27457 RepID=A0A6I9V7X6_BACDO|nr:uncharacterized protein LOC105227969 [Bactrocera dorsalis]